MEKMYGVARLHETPLAAQIWCSMACRNQPGCEWLRQKR
jgi:hypothetical protein